MDFDRNYSVFGFMGYRYFKPLYVDFYGCLQQQKANRRNSDVAYCIIYDYYRH
jgi:hypothetical protein